MRYLYFTTVFFLLMGVLQMTFAQSSSETPTPILPLYQFTQPFPLDLYCTEINEPYIGPTWNDLQVGVTTVAEFDEYMSNLHPTFGGDTFPYIYLLEYGMSPREALELAIPNIVSACYDPETNIITAISPNLVYDMITITDLVIQYGKPDTVTWRIGTETRVAFWFEEGIAATIRVDLSERFAPFGTILSMTYFPFQPVEGFETRWPFNRTVSGELLEQLERRATLTPEVPNVANPFDFDEMIATITAQPSRTPTLTQRPPTPTATSRP